MTQFLLWTVSDLNRCSSAALIAPGVAIIDTRRARSCRHLSVKIYLLLKLKYEIILVDCIGFEPMTSSMPSRRSSQLS